MGVKSVIVWVCETHRLVAANLAMSSPLGDALGPTQARPTLYTGVPPACVLPPSGRELRPRQVCQARPPLRGGVRFRREQPRLAEGRRAVQLPAGQGDRPRRERLRWPARSSASGRTRWPSSPWTTSTGWGRLSSPSSPRRPRSLGAIQVALAVWQTRSLGPAWQALGLGPCSFKLLVFLSFCSSVNITRKASNQRASVLFRLTSSSRVVSKC